MKIEDMSIYDNNKLLAFWLSNEELIDNLRHSQGRIEFELLRRMEQDGATAIPHPQVECKLVYPPEEVDRSKLYPLRELLPPEVIAEGFVPSHEETVQVPDKWDLRKVKAWAKYGAEVAKVIVGASLQIRPRLSIKPIKQEEVP